MAKKKTENGNEPLDFEAALAGLESIVRRLEDGGCPLEAALEDYAKAVQLLKDCHAKLELAQRKVEILSGVDAQGNPIAEPISDSEMQLDEKQEQRSRRRTAETPANRGARARSNDQDGLF